MEENQLSQDEGSVTDSEQEESSSSLSSESSSMSDLQ